MISIGWGLLGAGAIMALLVWLGFLPEEGDYYASGAWILIFFGVLIILFETAFGKRKK